MLTTQYPPPFKKMDQICHTYENPNPIIDPSDFDFADYLVEYGSTEELSQVTTVVLPETVTGESTVVLGGTTPRNSNIKCEIRSTKNKPNSGYKVAFRTKSEQDVMDDGYKWRKYGKKMVKNSPNPRNYYKCSNGGCNVKKRVEREIQDMNYVITTYEGVHNHPSPGVVYYNHTIREKIANGIWTLQASSSHSSS